MHTLQIQRQSRSVIFHLTTGTHGRSRYVLRNQESPQLLTQLTASGSHIQKAIQST